MTNSLTVVAKVFSNTLIFLLQKCGLLMTNSLTVVAKVFSNTLIFLLQKCE